MIVFAQNVIEQFIVSLLTYIGKRKSRRITVSKRSRPSKEGFETTTVCSAALANPHHAEMAYENLLTTVAWKTVLSAQFGIPCCRKVRRANSVCAHPACVASTCCATENRRLIDRHSESLDRLDARESMNSWRGITIARLLLGGTKTISTDLVLFSRRLLSRAQLNLQCHPRNETLWNLCVASCNLQAESIFGLSPIFPAVCHKRTSAYKLDSGSAHLANTFLFVLLWTCG
jgi:hypothetical protein